MWRNIKDDIVIAAKDPLTPTSLVLLTLVFALTGPFGSYNLLGFWDRLGMWVTVMLVASGVGIFAFFLTANLLPRRLSTIPVSLIAIAIATIPTSFAALWVDHIYLGAPVDGARFWVDLQNLFPLVAIVILMIATSRGGRDVIRLRHVDPRSSATPVARNFGAPVLYAHAQDHYVKFVTAEGARLVLMRFGDAVAQLESSEGAQIHRSYWVARTAIASVEREKDKAFVLVTDGARLPVSRSHRANLTALTGA